MHSKLRGRSVGTWITLATAGLLLAWLPALLHRSLDADELEHAHAAWCVSRGMLPYRDFFEHHTPWYYYLLRPFFHAFDVARSFDSARHFLLFGRGLSLLLTMVSVWLVVRIGKVLGQRRLGQLAGLLLVAQPIFFAKSMEMRPDVLALPWYLGGLWLLLRGIARADDRTARALRYFLGGGLCVGAGIMCTQKMLFVLPGLVAGLGLWALLGATHTVAGPGHCVRSRLLRMAIFLVGVGVPAAVTWTLFALQGAGREFVTNNFLLNARWKHIQTFQLYHLLWTSWPILALALLGIVALVAAWRRGRLPYGELLLLCTLLGLFAGVVVIPSAHGQYYLMHLPLACWFAAQGLRILGRYLPRQASLGLVGLALLPLGVLPGRALRDAYQLRNDRQLAKLSYVFAMTKPDDVVMDGWEGMGVFRPHAFYYFFLHEETRAMLPTTQLATFLDALENGRIRPRLIAMDRNLATLGARFQRIVAMGYVSNDGFFYFPARSTFWRTRPGELLRGVGGR